MHVLAKQFIRVFISQKAKAGWIAERTAAAEIDSIDGFGRGIEKEAEVILAFRQRRFHPFPFG